MFISNARAAAGRIGALAIGAVLTVSLGGCAGNAAAGTHVSPAAGEITTSVGTPPQSPPIFEIDAIEGMKYRLPKATSPAGVVTVTLVNNDDDMPHLAQLFKLHPGVTMKQFTTELLSPGGEGAVMPIADPAGGPNAVGPGHRTGVTLTLAPASTYAVICSVPGKDGTPHFAHGMITSFSTAAAADGATIPAAPATITLADDKYQLPDALDWSRPVEVVNSGKQPHEMQIFGPAPGKSVADIKAYLMAKPGAAPAGPPPYRAYGGVAAIAPGGHQEFTPGLPPGKYLLVCFVTDPKTHLPHFMMGMLSEITVS